MYFPGCDSYDWDAMDYLEGRCMDMCPAPDQECYNHEEEYGFFRLEDE